MDRRRQLLQDAHRRLRQRQNSPERGFLSDQSTNLDHQTNVSIFKQFFTCTCTYYMYMYLLHVHVLYKYCIVQNLDEFEDSPIFFSHTFSNNPNSPNLIYHVINLYYCTYDT